MDIITAVNNLYSNYKQHGITREQIAILMPDGIQRGFTVQQAYNGLRMSLGYEFNERELFSTSEVAEMLECTEQEVIEQLEKVKAELEEQGKDTSEYFIQPQQSMKFLYYPKKM